METYSLILKDLNTYVKVPLAKLNIHNITSIKDIDVITSSYTEEELKRYLKEEGVISDSDLDKEFKIVKKEQDNIKEYDVITFNEKEAISSLYITYFILCSIYKKEDLLKLINELEKYNNELLNNFILMLKSIDKMSIISFINELIKIKYFEYEEIRNIGLFIHKNISFKIKTDSKKLILNKKEK